MRVVELLVCFQTPEAVVAVCSYRCGKEQVVLLQAVGSSMPGLSSLTLWVPPSWQTAARHATFGKDCYYVRRYAENQPCLQSGE